MWDDYYEPSEFNEAIQELKQEVKNSTQEAKNLTQKGLDTISRTASIDALDALCERECEYSKKQRSVMCGACHLGSAFDVIEQLPSAQPEPRWIPVTERLPEERIAVFVYAPKYHNIFMGYLTDDGWKTWAARNGGYDWPTVHEITHWMHIPEPPKEKV